MCPRQWLPRCCSQHRCSRCSRTQKGGCSLCSRVQPWTGRSGNSWQQPVAGLKSWPPRGCCTTPSPPSSCSEAHLRPAHCGVAPALCSKLLTLCACCCAVLTSQVEAHPRPSSSCKQNPCKAITCVAHAAALAHTCSSNCSSSSSSLTSGLQVKHPVLHALAPVAVGTLQCSAVQPVWQRLRITGLL